MEELLEGQSKLSIDQPPHWIDTNLGQSWLDIHRRMQTTIGLPCALRSQSLPIKQNNDLEQRNKNRMLSRIYQFQDKKQKRVNVSSRVQKNQLKILLNDYKQSEIWRNAASERLKPRFASLYKEPVLQFKYHQLKIQNLEYKEVTKKVPKTLKSFSHSSLFPICSRASYYQKSAERYIQQTQLANQVHMLHLPCLFKTGQKTLQSVQKSPESKNTRFQNFKKNLGLCSPHKQEYGPLTRVIQQPGFNALPLINQNGSFHLENNDQLNTSEIYMKSHLHTNKGNQLTSNLKGLKQLSCGLICSLNRKAIHSLDQLRNKAKFDAIKFKHESLQKLRQPNQKKDERLPKQNVKDKIRANKDFKDLKEVKNRLSLNPQTSTKLR